VKQYSIFNLQPIIGVMTAVEASSKELAK
jgi:hypothetical protein